MASAAEPLRAQVAAGIVVFNPSVGLTDLCGQLRQQGCTVMIHDNASTDALEILAACETLGAQIHRATVNSGVAGGLEALLNRAQDYPFLITFDQDSRIDPDYIAALMASQAWQDPDVAIVAPRVLELNRGQVMQGGQRDEWHRVDRAITSGALCRVAALQEIGGFREDLFIDYVDFDICLRLQSAHRWTTVEPRAVLKHTLGNQTEHRILGLVTVFTTHHSPDRRYYRYRNYLLLLRAGTFAPRPRQIFVDGLRLTSEAVVMLMFEHDRRAKFRALIDAFFDGMRGIGGPRPHRLS
jgi:rhamnosyltransferase